MGAQCSTATCEATKDGCNSCSAHALRPDDEQTQGMKLPVEPLVTLAEGVQIFDDGDRISDMTGDTRRDLTSSQDATDFVQEWPGIGRLEPGDLDFTELTRGKPSRRIPEVEHRGVTLNNLREVLSYIKRRCEPDGCIRGWYDPRTGRQLYYRSITMSQVTHWVIQPITRLQRCSMSEILATKQQSQIPNWFVAQWGHESFVDFVRRVKRNSIESNLADTETYWICAFATRVHECCGLTVAGNPGHGVMAWETIATIKANLRGTVGTHVDELLKALSALPALKVLGLDFSACFGPEGNMNFEHLAGLEALDTLHINMSGMSELTSIEDMGRSISVLRDLSCLELDLSSCSRLEAVDVMGTSLRKHESLTSLALNFSHCTGIFDIVKLSRGIATLVSLRSLRLMFSNCAGLQSIEELGVALKSLRNLEELELICAGCIALSSLGQLGAALGGLQALTKLELSFFGCTHLESTSSLGQGIGKLHSLNDLKLSFYGCSSLHTFEELQKGVAELRKKCTLSTFEFSTSGCTGSPMGSIQHPSVKGL